MRELPPSAILLSGAASGLLLAAATAQTGLGLLCFVALVPLLRLLDRGPLPLQALAAGGLAGLLLFSCALGWIPFAGYPAALVLVAGFYVLLCAAGLGVLCAGLAWLRAGDRRLFLLATPLVWITFEFVRSQGPLGYPGHHLAYSLASHPALIQLAAFGGLYALSLWIVSVNCALCVAIGAPRPHALAWALLLAVPLLPGVRSLGAEPGTDSLRLAAVQPMIMVPARIAPERFQANLASLLELTESAAGDAADLVVWPESAYERAVSGEGDPLLASIAARFEVPVLTGAWRFAPGGGAQPYNSALLATADGRIRVAGDKVRPVPFYERAPTSALERALSRLGLWRGRFRAGRRPGLIALGSRDAAGPLIGVLICVDSAYPTLARDLRLRGARLLVEISNEAQTGAWSAHQHALVSRLRAVETGAPLLRVGNTGPSEWIDARGRVVARIEPGQRASLSADLTLAGALTFYARVGDAPAFAVGALPLFALFAARRRAVFHTCTIAKESSPC